MNHKIAMVKLADFCDVFPNTAKKFKFFLDYMGQLKDLGHK